MGKQTFENAVVGDRVESVLRGEGTVSYIHKQDLQQCTAYPYPLVILFDSGEKASYTINGKARETNMHQELYWPGVQIISPEPPKRKVKKTIKRWVNIYRNKHDGDMSVAMCGSKDDTEMRCDNNLICIDTHIVDIIYEIDDDI